MSWSWEKYITQTNGIVYTVVSTSFLISGANCFVLILHCVPWVTLFTSFKSFDFKQYHLLRKAFLNVLYVVDTGFAIKNNHDICIIGNIVMSKIKYFRICYEMSYPYLMTPTFFKYCNILNVNARTIKY